MQDLCSPFFCKYCGAVIFWVQDGVGHHPVNAQRDGSGPDAQQYDKEIMVSHLVTCQRQLFTKSKTNEQLELWPEGY